MRIIGGQMLLGRRGRLICEVVEGWIEECAGVGELVQDAFVCYMCTKSVTSGRMVTFERCSIIMCA